MRGLLKVVDAGVFLMCPKNNLFTNRTVKISQISQLTESLHPSRNGVNVFFFKLFA